MKNGLPYYKAYPRDFIEGTIGMEFEIKCAYRVILDLIYMQGGHLPDDARYISGMLGCSIRKWKSIRETLVDLGKVYVSGEFLSNYRADKEIETLAKLQDKQRENATRSSKINDLQKPWLHQPEPEPEPEVREDGGGSSASAGNSAGSDLAKSDRELILEAMGVGPDGVIGPSKFIGGQSDMAEVARWLALPSVTVDAACAEIRSVMAAKRDGPPSGFRYFTPSMQRLSGALSAAPLAPMARASPHQSAAPPRRLWNLNPDDFNDNGSLVKK